jgi:S1-C subfamily serine protease
MIRRLSIALLTLPLLAAAARAEETPDLAALAPQVAKSLVLVEYTFKNENGSQEEFGQGIVLNKEGTVLISGSFIPEAIPPAWIMRLKIRVPAQHFQTVPAMFLGRTQDRLFAFIKAEKPLAAEPLDLTKTAPTKLGQTVYSVGIQPKEGAYENCAAINHVKAVFHTSHSMAATETYGLTRVNSPVFDAATNALVGITFAAPRRDEEQPGFFITAEDIKASVTEIPTKPFHLKRSWLGAEGLSGVDEDLRKDFKIEQPACVSIGSIIPGEAADKAGLKPQDVIVTINGKPFSESPVPEFVPTHFYHAIEYFRPGDKATLGIVRRVDSDKTPDHSGIERKNIEVTFGALPASGADMPHTFDAAVGITTRDLVFTDIYSRHLSSDQKGVYVAMVKQNSPAFISDTRLHPGYLITKVNDQEVASNEQFGKLLKATESDPTNKQILFLAVKPDGSTSVCRIDLTATPSSTSQRTPPTGPADNP